MKHAIMLIVSSLFLSACFQATADIPYCTQHNGNYSDCRDEWLCTQDTNPTALNLDTTCEDKGVFSPWTREEVWCCELDFGKP